jgi:hypothetical protein
MTLMFESEKVQMAKTSLVQMSQQRKDCMNVSDTNNEDGGPLIKLGPTCSQHTAHSDWCIHNKKHLCH